MAGPVARPQEERDGMSVTEALKPILNLALYAVPISLAARSAPVLTYHACYKECPPAVDPVDNITPQQLYEQIEELKRYCRIVTIDEFSEAKNTRGLAAITFDDGYKSVVTNALPVFVALDVPVTVFVNSRSFEGNVFWRHKVVYIIEHGLVEECERSFVKVKRVPGESFHRYLKNNINHSGVVEEELDRFLSQKDIKLPACDYLFDDRKQMIDHGLLSYGNHSHRHYVMSSLPLLEQQQEIQKTESFLKTSGVFKSGVFSLPFGETHHFNNDTCFALRDQGYHVLLLNRGTVNYSKLKKAFGLKIVERFSPSVDNLGRQLNIQFCRGATAGFLR
jgi:peptidoglycan/xylan/chitin deacetylase (PgdA/CDA1 family)